ncbi:MAG: hypothetical protein QNJ31_05170 [Candidatus Caenarcaniphilales bacterium]|nr:hypothetical protein [Candidatus Caenarcaniphilales bacterium]
MNFSNLKPSRSFLVTFHHWFFQELHTPSGPHGKAEHKHPWWQVMCLTGVDYFSTLGYQPAIAFLAAGFLSPIATLVLVLVTLFAAFPIYSKVAEQSPDGQGSIFMLEKLFPKWKGKASVLFLLGFAATDFIITITLSAADATAHIIENPFVPEWMHHKVLITLALITFLGAVFMKGFKEAISLAVVIVVLFLGINSIVIFIGLSEIIQNPSLILNWKEALFKSHSENPFLMLGVALVLFPKLALGLSGFETGVAVMPLVKGEQITDRIKDTKKLLLSAALIMSVFLLSSSFVTTLLIPSSEFEPGGEANGRALAYLAHLYLGDMFGSIYDISTILILGFAGASALAGLLNLVPRYLPRYGMAPEWSKASRPLVVVFTIIAFIVTLIFKADVDAQGGAYATGVLVLMCSGSVAVLVSVWNSASRFFFLLVTGVFIYTTALNIIERPEGMKIAFCFIVLTITISLVSRAMRSTELRIKEVILDDTAKQFLAEDYDQIIHIVAHRPGDGSVKEYNSKVDWARELHHLDGEEQIIFIEIQMSDASDFDAPLHVSGTTVGPHKILRASSPAIPNAIAALLLNIEQITGKLPHAYFGWTEGNPIEYLFRYIFFGEGDVAPMAREVLRQKIPDPKKRPYIHVS